MGLRAAQIGGPAGGRGVFGRGLAAVWGLAMGLGLTIVPARAQTAPEYEVKAAVLFKLASFVSWPADSNRSPVCIGVIGIDPFGRYLEQGLQEQRGRGKEFRVERFRTVEQAGNCQVLFISSSEKKRVHKILDALRDKPVLTVADMVDFCQDGGIVNLQVEGSTVRLGINVEAGRQRGLQFSYKLLRLSQIVFGAPL
jgi:hypothetical protein